MFKNQMYFLLFRIAMAIHCLGNTGTYVINVKIYPDEASVIAIGHFMERLIHNTNNNLDEFHQIMRKKNLCEFTVYSAYTKKFIGLLFDTINAQLLDSNVQFRADFSEMLHGEYTEMQKKYCKKGNSIIGITEEFLEESARSGDSGQNRLLIINCHGNLASMPAISHIASRNRCGHVLGISLSDPGSMRTTIIEALYAIIMNATSVGNVDSHLKLTTNACAYINYCNRWYPDTGGFYPNLRSLGTPAQLRKLEYLKGDMFSGGFDWTRGRNRNVLTVAR